MWLISEQIFTQCQDFVSEAAYAVPTPSIKMMLIVKLWRGGLEKSEIDGISAAEETFCVCISSLAALSDIKNRWNVNVDFFALVHGDRKWMNKKVLRIWDKRFCAGKSSHERGGDPHSRKVWEYRHVICWWGGLRFALPRSMTLHLLWVCWCREGRDMAVIGCYYDVRKMIGGIDFLSLVGKIWMSYYRFSHTLLLACSASL